MSQQSKILTAIDSVLTGAPTHLKNTGQPYVTLTYAQSIDGSIAQRSGRPLSLSAPQSMRLTHRLRTIHDAVLVGIGTVLADDPRLSARSVPGKNPQPVVIDTRLRLPLEAQLLRDRSRMPWIITSTDANSRKGSTLTKAGARVIRLPATPDGYIDLAALLQWLGSVNISSLMVEGGAQIITNFLKYRLVNQVVLTMAPIFVGGLRAIHPLHLDAKKFPRLLNTHYEKMGADLVLRADVTWDET